MISDLRSKIERLISLYEREKQRGDELASQLEASRAEIADKKQQITELKSQIDHYKLAGAFTSSEDVQTSKERLNKLIRDIDKCIKLLAN